MNKEGKVDVILGLQWGDEGKGKIVDILSTKYDNIARFQGGQNAGHTLTFGKTQIVLRSVPSGVFNSHGMNIIGNGVVFDPILFRNEINEIANHIPDVTSRIIISNTCHVITPFHKLQDIVNEIRKGDNKVGTTGKGIGPAYSNKADRIGIPLVDALNNTDFAEAYIGTILYNFRCLSANVSIDDVPEEYKRVFEEITSADDELIKIGVKELLYDYINSLIWLKNSKIAIKNTVNYINKELSIGHNVLAEGAQGTMLDVNFGTYPFVTSSNTVSGGACIGLGVAPNKIGDVYGVFKTYCTRVGSGPFPTEQNNSIGELIGDKGHEFGSVTKRRRRCGWLDLVQLKYACMLNGVNKLIVTKADVLNGFANVDVCIKYSTIDGEDIDGYPNNPDLNKIVPNYITFKGWQEVYQYDERGEDVVITPNLKTFLSYIEEYLGIPIYAVSYGPDREHILYNI